MGAHAAVPLVPDFQDWPAAGQSPGHGLRITRKAIDRLGRDRQSTAVEPVAVVENDQRPRQRPLREGLEQADHAFGDALAAVAARRLFVSGPVDFVAQRAQAQAIDASEHRTDLLAPLPDMCAGADQELPCPGPRRAAAERQENASHGDACAHACTTVIRAGSAAARSARICMPKPMNSQTSGMAMSGTLRNHASTPPSMP